MDKKTDGQNIKNEFKNLENEENMFLPQLINGMMALLSVIPKEFGNIPVFEGHQSATDHFSYTKEELAQLAGRYDGVFHHEYDLARRKAMETKKIVSFTFKVETEVPCARKWSSDMKTQLVFRKNAQAGSYSPAIMLVGGEEELADALTDTVTANVNSDGVITNSYGMMQDSGLTWQEYLQGKVSEELCAKYVAVPVSAIVWRVIQLIHLNEKAELTSVQDALERMKSLKGMPAYALNSVEVLLKDLCGKEFDSVLYHACKYWSENNIVQVFPSEAQYLDEEVLFEKN